MNTNQRTTIEFMRPTLRAMTSEGIANLILSTDRVTTELNNIIAASYTDFEDAVIRFVKESDVEITGDDNRIKIIESATAALSFFSKEYSNLFSNYMNTQFSILAFSESELYERKFPTLVENEIWEAGSMSKKMNETISGMANILSDSKKSKDGLGRIKARTKIELREMSSNITTLRHYLEFWKLYKESLILAKWLIDIKLPLIGISKEDFLELSTDEIGVMIGEQ